MRAHEIMTTSVVTTTPDTPVGRVAELLAEHSITSLPVLDADARIVGMISEGDVIRNRMPSDPRSHMRPEPAQSPDPPRLVGEVMSRDVVCLGQGADTAEITAVMLAHKIRAIPIVDAGRLVGIVARRDLLRTLLRDDDVIGREVNSRLVQYAGEDGRWSVTVDAGVVTVRGRFDDPGQEAIVTVLARTVPGVVRVHTRGE